MNRKKKTPNPAIWGCLVLTGLVACSSPPSKPDAISPTPTVENPTSAGATEHELDLERRELQYWQKRRKLVKDRDLFEVLSKYADQRSKDHFEVFQILCEGPRCSFQTASGLPGKGAGRVVKLTSEDSSKLFSLLVNLPISKGETGAAVDYLSCRRYQLAEPSGWKHSCTVAAPLGMIPHTSLPIPDLVD